MSACDMCGSAKDLVKAVIEGAELDVCPNCAKFGKIIVKPQKKFFKNIETRRQTAPVKRTETIQVIVPNFGQLIKNAREKKGIKQEELAKKIAEKESLVNKIEAGHLKPSISAARKLEQFLNITLIEQHEEKHQPLIKGSERKDTFTMADFVKIKKR